MSQNYEGASMKKLHKKIGIIALSVIMVYAFAACKDEPEDDPPKPEIPAEYQNKSWSHTDGYKIKLEKDRVIIMLTNGTTTTYSYTSVETINGNTVLHFETKSDIAGMITFKNGTLIGIVFPVLTKSGGWTAGDSTIDSTNPNLTGSDTIQGADLAAKLAWIKANAQSNATYIVTVDKNEELGGIDRMNSNYSNNSNYLRYEGKSNITVQLQGTGGEKTITLSSNGNLFYVESGVTLILDNNITLQGKSDNDSNLVYVSQGTLEMKTGAKISGNTLSSSYYSYGGGVYVTGGTFTMSGGEISGNTASSSSSYSYGGGVYVTGGTFTMSGGKISGNTVSSSEYIPYGGGVYVTGGTFTMNGGEISGNTNLSDSGEGGGVYVEGGTFTMSGGKISNNTAFRGGGVFVKNETFTMSGGEISNNTVVFYGGGVNVNGGTFTMSGGKISGNTVSGDGGEGGGVYTNGTFIMEGGEIFSNTAYFGGGVSVLKRLGGVLTKTGGTITGSDASNGNIASRSSSYNYYGVRLKGGNAVCLHNTYSSIDNWHRETTAGPTVNLYSSESYEAGGWDDKGN